MKADEYDLRTVFANDRQLFAPLYQRPYVWEQEKQWEPLWKDLRSMAECLMKNHDNVRPHFMGAVVLDQLRVPVGKPDARRIIDGQQRLTTLQILLAAFRDRCGEKQELKRLSKAAEQLMYNNDPMVETEVDRFKVWPTNVDIPTYRVVMTAGSPDDARRLLNGKDCDEQSQIAKGYRFFYNAIDKWVKEDMELLGDKLQALLFTIREKVRFVVIDMDEHDDAQIIFETLNARGTALLPADLVKNFLFHRAREERANVQSLYKLYWEPFDQDYKFWRKEMRQGRLKRPRIDLFLQHYVTLKNDYEVSTTKLFTEFKLFAERYSNQNSKWHLRSLKEHGELFRKFLNVSQETREGVFFSRLHAMETTTVFPFLLGLYALLDGSNNESAEKLAIIEDLESFLVRRMICRLTTKNYNRLFLDLVKELRKKGKSKRWAVRGFLIKQTAESTRWPNDEEFRQAWLNKPLYKVLSRPRVRMLLGALDEGLHGPKTENYRLKDNLTIEHILPQDWEEHWSLKDSGGDENVEEAFERKERRNRLIHTVGNLTLLTKALNPAISNGPFERKKTEILKHSALNLNRFLEGKKNWDEESILKRGKQLFLNSKKIWSHPGTTL